MEFKLLKDSSIMINDKYKFNDKAYNIWLEESNFIKIKYIFLDPKYIIRLGFTPKLLMCRMYKERGICLIDNCVFMHNKDERFVCPRLENKVRQGCINKCKMQPVRIEKIKMLSLQRRYCSACWSNSRKEISNFYCFECDKFMCEYCASAIRIFHRTKAISVQTIDLSKFPYIWKRI